MNNWYKYIEKFKAIEKIEILTFIPIYFHIKDTNLVYGPMVLDSDYLVLQLFLDDKRRLFYIEDIITKLTEEETYQRTLDLHGYLRLKFAT